MKVSRSKYTYLFPTISSLFQSSCRSQINIYVVISNQKLIYLRTLILFCCKCPPFNNPKCKYTVCDYNACFLCKGYKPKTVHSVRERTDRGPQGREQFFLSQNVQFSAYILYIFKIVPPSKNVDRSTSTTTYIRLFPLLYVCISQKIKEKCSV